MNRLTKEEREEFVALINEQEACYQNACRSFNAEIDALKEELAGSRLWSQALANSLDELRSDMQELRKQWEHERSVADSLEHTIEALQCRLSKYEATK